MTHRRNTYFGGVPTVCHSCRFFYYILEVFRQCVILVDFSIILWSCSNSLSSFTPSEHLQNIIEKSTKDDTLSEHLQNIIEHSTRDDTLSELLQNIIEKRCSDSVSFLSIFLSYFGGVPTVCHSCRFFYYILEVFRQCVILVDFSIIQE
jgi:hypothetical protein